MYKVFDKKIVLISMCCLIGAPLSANAQGFENLLRIFLGANGNNQPAAQQDLIKTNLNTRQAQLESEISAGVTSGQLNAQEEADLRAELNRIASVEGQYLADGNLTNSEVQTLVDDMTNLTRRLQTYLANTIVVGTGTSRHDDWFRRYGGPNAGPGNQAQRQAHLDSRQSELDARIVDGVVSGRLNSRESYNLRAELNRIANDELEALADGRLSYDEQQRLLASLDALDTRITAQLSDANWNRRNRGGGINRQQSLLRQRINSGIRSGRLSRSEGDRLLAKEQRIRDLEARLRASGCGLSFNESRRLNVELADLSREIGEELSDRNVW